MKREEQMIDRQIKIKDGPDGEVAVEKQSSHLHGFDSRLALNLGGKGEYLAVYLTPREARLIAKALLESVVGVKRKEARRAKTWSGLARQVW
jgi:hypothetical protein